MVMHWMELLTPTVCTRWSLRRYKGCMVGRACDTSEGALDRACDTDGALEGTWNMDGASDGA